jgi:aconitase A
MNKKETVKPSKNLKMAAGLVASAAAATVAAMAYKVNEEKINKVIDKAADGTKVVIEKASKKVKEVADDIMAKVEEEMADKPCESADEEIVEVEIVDVEEVAAEEVPAEEPAPEEPAPAEEEKTEI